MKTRLTFSVMFIFILYFSITQAQEYPHIPIPHSHEGESTGNCLGYAAVRAFQMKADEDHDDYCDAETCYIDETEVEVSDYFDEHTGTKQQLLDGVDVGDMLKFSTGGIHYIYITEKNDGDQSNSYEDDEVFFWAVEYDGGPITNGTVYDAIYSNPSKNILEHYEPVSYWTLKKKPKFVVENYFIDSPHTGGNVKVDGDTYSSGTQTDKQYWDTNHTMETLAVGTVHAGYIQILNKWMASHHPEASIGDTPEISHRIDWYTGSKTFTAHLGPELEITFRNQFIGISGYPGTIEVDDTTRNSPYTKGIIKGNDIEGRGLNQTITGINYTFDKWHDEVTTNPRTFSPEGDEIYTSHFTGKPKSMYFYDLQVVGGTGDNVKLEWTVHPHASVSYEVWRKVKPLGEPCGAPAKQATLTHSTTTWTDPDYKITPGYTDDLVYYDVRSYYSIEESYSDPEWVDAFAEILEKRLPEEYMDIISIIPESFYIAAYPNPFNPETTLHYRLSTQAYVTLIICDMLGREIDALVEANQPAGQYSFRWTAKHASGNTVPSGIYFYRFKAVPNSGGDVFHKSGKLMFLK